jgi:micrococcal nuclease
MNTYSISNVRVIDGDTFDCLINLGFDLTLKQRVRLRNIDTPECRTKDAEEKKYGLMAKRKLIELVKGASELTLKCEAKREKFGRVLGELWAGPINVNQWLCDNHYAVPYAGQSRDDVAQQHLDNRAKLVQAEQ